MKFAKPLIEGILIQRYKRFFADVEYEIGSGTKKTTEKATIHVPNTGSLKAVIEKKPTEPQKCWFSLHHDPAKKLKGTLEVVQTVQGSWVGVNTSNPNKIVAEAFQNSIASGNSFLPEWKGYGFYKPEYKINDKSRLDGALLKSESDLEDAKSKKHFIEIKNTTYKTIINGKAHAQFPDAVTERGQKRLEEMRLLMKKGQQCEVIFTVQRTDVECFSPCKELDPAYAKLLYKAIDQGLIVSPLICEISREQVVLTNKKLKLVDY